mgnify:CR=1 FL=1
MERRLGRGLGSLLSDRDSAKESRPSSTEIDVTLVKPNPFQPRRYFDPEGIDELAESLKTHGLLQPIVVRQVGSIFELIAGERRLRAAQKIGLQRLPAVVRFDVPDEQMLELALVENVQRRDLDPIERAIGYKQLLDRLALTQDEVAQRVGLKRSTVANHLRLLDLPAPVQEALGRNQITMGHARALLGLASATERVDLAVRIAEEGLSVREVERLVREITHPTAIDDSPAATIPDNLAATTVDEDGSEAKIGGKLPTVDVPTWVAGLQDRLQEALGTRVELRTRPGFTGQIVVHYFDREDLERLLEQLAPSQTL